MVEYAIQLSPKRWLVLLTVLLLTLMYMFAGLSFGPIDNIVVAYYNISYTASDWIVLTTYVSAVIFLPVLAWYSFTERLDLKRLLLACSIAFLFDCILSIVSFFKPNLFALILLGQFLVGFLRSAYSSFPGAVAATWFSESRIGIITGIITMSWNAGMLLSELLLENILQNPPNLNSSTSLKKESDAQWFLYDQTSFVAVYATLSSLTFFVFLSVLLVIPTLPDFPPSLTQAAKRLTSQRTSATFKQFLSEIKGLLTDRTFVLIQLIMGLCVQTFVLETLIMQELIESILPMLNIQKSSAMIGGYVLACRSVGDMLGSAIGGKALDTWRKYRLQTIIGTGSAFAVIFGIFVSYYFASFIGLCLSMFLFGACSYISVLPLYDSILQHTYPLNMILVLSIAGSLRFCVTIIISETGRLFLHFTGPYGVLIFHCFLQFLGFLLSFLMRPELKRSTVEQSYLHDSSDSLNASETTSILHN